MTTRAVCVDVMGTLFDLSAPRRRLEDLGAPPPALEAWFGRLLHTAATVTLIDDYRPFPELAKPVLESVLAQAGPRPRRRRASAGRAVRARSLSGRRARLEATGVG